MIFSPYSDFVSRIWIPFDNLLFGAEQKEIASHPSQSFGVPTTFNGLNYNIYEPITYNLTLGYGKDYNTSASLEYINEDLMRSGSSAVEFPFTNPPDKAKATLFNHIMLKRNGPYGYPVFKQIRTGEHPIARNLRKNNLIACTTEPGETTEINGIQYIERYGKTNICREPVVNSSYGTLDYLLGLRVSTENPGQNPEYILRPIQIKTTYGNNLGYFSSQILNVCADYNKTGLSSQPQAYDTIKGMYLDGALNDVNSPVYSLISLKYSEKVFPAALNSYSGINRKRTDYVETFWRDNIIDRGTLGKKKFYGDLIKNSANDTVSRQSAWALDANAWWEYQTQPTSDSEITSSSPQGMCNPIAWLAKAGNNRATGELQNGYVSQWKYWEADTASSRNTRGLRDGALYSRKNGTHSYYSVVSPSGM